MTHDDRCAVNRLRGLAQDFDRNGAALFAREVAEIAAVDRGAAELVVAMLERVAGDAAAALRARADILEGAE